MVLSLVLLSLAVPALAMNDEHNCIHGHEDTVEGLIACFQNHIAMGHITDPDVAQGLLDKLYAAQNALARGQSRVAVNNLNALINQIEAQSGRALPENHAQHMIDHVERVIDSLS